MKKKYPKLLAIIFILLLISCSEESSKQESSPTIPSGGGYVDLSVDEWENAYFRGTANSWGLSPMTKVASNTWEVTVKFNSGDSDGGPRFRIDKGEWSEAYPNGDFIVDSNETYKITFYDDSHYIEVNNVNSSNSTNNTMMQYFHWYYPSDGSLWAKVSSESQELAEMGIDSLWLPPAYKGGSGFDVGYGVYDMYDLGEFDQKGTVRTKYGTKDEYLNAIDKAHENGIEIYGDIVFNHRGNADYAETVNAKKVDWDDRNTELSNSYEIEAWTGFNFDARNNKYSDFKYHWYHFDGVDWDQKNSESAIFKFTSNAGYEDKEWDWTVTDERGNFDYLMYADLDFDNAEVVQESKDWGEWYTDFTDIDGFRVDAVKHIKYEFIAEWIEYLRSKTGKDLFTVGEFWDYDINKLTQYLSVTKGTVSLFDTPLHGNFHSASISSGNYDMRTLMDNTLMKSNPMKAVTLVENHDTQPLQSFDSSVEAWFKPLAYAFILLRQEGHPSVFYADLYGAEYSDKGYNIDMEIVTNLEKLIKARKLYAYGKQNSYMDDKDIIAWTRLGDEEHPKAMAVIMSDAAAGTKWMKVEKANTKFYDYTGTISETITSNSEGWAQFKCNSRSVSVWVQE